MKMNRQGHDRVHLRPGTQVVVVTGRSFVPRQRRSIRICVYIPQQMSGKVTVHVMPKMKK